MFCESVYVCLYHLGCSPTANYTFNSNQWSFAYENVSFTSGQAFFTGSGLINLYRFANDDFAQRLVIHIVATPQNQGDYNKHMHILFSILYQCSFSLHVSDYSERKEIINDT